MHLHVENHRNTSKSMDKFFNIGGRLFNSRHIISLKHIGKGEIIENTSRYGVKTSLLERDEVAITVARYHFPGTYEYSSGFLPTELYNESDFLRDVHSYNIYRYPKGTQEYSDAVKIIELLKGNVVVPDSQQ